MRVCSTCKILKPFSEFHKKGNGHAYKCKRCRSEYIKKHYQDNKEKYNRSAKAIRKRNIEYVRRIKESTPCADCNKFYPYYVMDFDHRHDKLFNIGGLRNKGIRQIKAEIKKCELVCANCHRERTHGSLG